MSTQETRNIRVDRATFNKLFSMALERDVTITVVVKNLVDNEMQLKESDSDD